MKVRSEHEVLRTTIQKVTQNEIQRAGPLKYLAVLKDIRRSDGVNGQEPKRL